MLLAKFLPRGRDHSVTRQHNPRPLPLRMPVGEMRGKVGVHVPKA